MPMESVRYEVYNKQLCSLLKTATDCVKTHYDALNPTCQMLRIMALQMLKLSLRHQMTANHKTEAAKKLIADFHGIHDFMMRRIKDLNKTVVDIAGAVAEYEKICADLEAEQEKPCSGLIAFWLTWLKQMLNVLQTHVKYLELHATELVPTNMDRHIFQSFENDLKLREHHNEEIRMGLARAKEIPTDLLTAD